MTPEDLDALPVGSVVWSAGRVVYTKIGPHGDEWASDRNQHPSALMLDGRIVSQPLTLLHVPGRDLLAEAEARGVERGRREALTEAADAAFKDKNVQGLARVTIGTWLRARARAAETPGGAA